MAAALFRNLGIADHLRAGFLAIVGFVVLAAAAGIYAFVDISGALNRITQERVPSTIAAQQLARRTQVIVDTAPGISAAQDRETFKARRATLFKEVRELRRLVTRVEGESLDLAAAPFRRLVSGLDDNLRALSETVSRSLSVRARLESKTQTWDHHYQALLNLLQPVVQVRRARLQGLREAMDAFTEGSDAKIRTGRELRRRLQTFLPLQDLRVVLARMNDHFLAAVEADGGQALARFRGQLRSDLDRTDALLPELDLNAASLMGGRVDELRAVVTGSGNALSLRAEALALRDRVDILLSENETLSARLSVAVDDLVARSNRQIAEAAQAAERTKLTGFALLIGVIVLSIVSAGLIMRHYVGRRVVRRLTQIRDAMLALSRGNLNCPLPASSGDEIGRMAEALQVFRDNAVRLEERTQELQAARDAAMQSNEAKTRFLANMSHELRTPLNAVIGFAEIIQNEALGPLGEPRYRDYATDIHDSAAHLLEVINDILDVAKAEAGRLEIQDESVDTRQVVAKVLRLMQPRAEQAEVTLDMHLPDPAPRLIADPRRLRQILLNQISNAIKFTEPDGTVCVELTPCPDGGLYLDVVDTGIGMSESELKLALAPFSQIDNSFSRQAEGTGLGLPLTKHLIELHQGRFELLSRKGAGTRCRAAFPSERVEWIGAGTGNGTPSADRSLTGT